MSRDFPNSSRIPNPNLLRPDIGISKGSYESPSYLSLHDSTSKTVRNAMGLRSNKSSFPTSPQLSTASLSHLRLTNLAKTKNWELLEDFDLEELRDGFFDPIFTKPEKKYVTIDNDIDPARKIKGKGAHFKRKLITILKNYFIYDEKTTLSHVLFDNWQSLFKYFIAYFISIVLCVIHPSGEWIGHKYRYFLPIATLIHHPVRNIGIQVEISLMSIIGAVFAMGWSSLAWYISTATKPTASHQGGILFQSMIMALWLSTWLKAYYQRTLYFSLSFSIAIIFFHTVDLVHSPDELKWILFRDFGLSYLFGILVSLLVCIAIFPHFGNGQLINRFSDSIDTIKTFLICIIDKDQENKEIKLRDLQNSMIRSLNIDLAQEFRDFLSQVSISKFKTEDLKTLRNNLTTLSSPLRVLPLAGKILDTSELEILYKDISERKLNQENEDSNEISEDTSKFDTPTSFKANGIFTPLGSKGTNIFFVQILRNTFSKPIFELILKMIVLLDSCEVISKFNNDSTASKDEMDNLERNMTKLKKRIYNLDVTYKKFTKSSFFSNDLLKDHDCVNIFLFLRYLRNAAKDLIIVTNTVLKMGSNIHRRLNLPKYPLKRALHRLPKQCSIDEGSGNALHYFETKKDVDDIMEKLYNSYTSRHAYNKGQDTLVSTTDAMDSAVVENDGKKEENSAAIPTRAIDHTDFNLHTTKNPWRYRFWRFTIILGGQEMKWTFKILFVMTFLCLPSWLPESYRWYQEYQCWWCPMIFFMLSHSRYSGQWNTLIRRICFGLIGIFWGWAANQSRHFSNSFVVATFAGLIVIPFAINHLIFYNTRSSFTGMICFTIIALEPFSKGNQTTSKIWKNTWTTGLALLIGVALSIPVSWLVWSFRAKSELRISISSLLAYLSQSYQSVTDRYLYRDSHDAPTELTLAFAHIREVRLTQNIEAIRDLLKMARNEPSFVYEYPSLKYKELIDSCQFLMERIIEARVSGSFFEVWDRDLDNETTRALLSLRRDSVSSVIFVFYILSNCFRSKNKIPKYLPNCVLARKKLFDFIDKFEHERTYYNNNAVEENNNTAQNTLLKKALMKISKPQIDDDDAEDGEEDGVDKCNNDVNEDKYVDDESYEKLHWTEVHGIAFARAFTDISESMQRVIDGSKAILGEEYF
ncbi:Bre4p NDAI_0H03920 [Naumovozyma dairenensis CBS 421]|uniref:ER transporter 6TM N-terminal domain-containing protein n=1 Tax=Naumovozyma dairenensis (strain ATCC 10597 / BCRC 20456 / CBS 421 / NBRC 0211 / NRRL Y-12639) TaxID=1071378 RepID=G0WFK4_NAUDC|nr:hypothetical protein NDAI_0H03920 [Naumovozyma dairenensis CBS 421]CCD26565.1 hypothetical protein NDAI_0H03920 [Naumovozyma dairenensis CBS 421]